MPLGGRAHGGAERRRDHPDVIDLWAMGGSNTFALCDGQMGHPWIDENAGHGAGPPRCARQCNLPRCSRRGSHGERVVAMEAAARGVPEDSVRTLYADGNSLRTWVTADDLAEMILFLTSPQGAKISGQAIAVDGNTERMT